MHGGGPLWVSSIIAHKIDPVCIIAYMKVAVGLIARMSVAVDLIE